MIEKGLNGWINKLMPSVKVYSQWTGTYSNWIQHFHTVLNTADKNFHPPFLVHGCSPLTLSLKGCQTALKEKWLFVELPIFPFECIFNFFVVRYDIILQQSVGTEDVFIGLSGKDPSSMCCEAMLVILYFLNLIFLCKIFIFQRTLMGGNMWGQGK